MMRLRSVYVHNNATGENVLAYTAESDDGVTVRLVDAKGAVLRTRTADDMERELWVAATTEPPKSLAEQVADLQAAVEGLSR